MNLNLNDLVTDDIFVKLAENGDIPSRYKYDHPEKHFILRHIKKLQENNLLRTPKEAIFYLKDLLSDEIVSDYENFVLFLSKLSDEEKERIVSLGVRENDLLDYSLEDIERLISSS